MKFLRFQKEYIILGHLMYIKSEKEFCSFDVVLNL